MMRNYQQVPSRFAVPTEIFVSGNTLQLRDYSNTNWPWSMFDPEAKKVRHETVFPEEMKKVYEMGMTLAG